MIITTPLLIFFLSLFQNVATLYYPQAPQELDCNRVTGNFNLMSMMLKRPLQIGDSITWNGTVSPTATRVHWTIYSTATLTSFPFLIRQDVGRDWKQWTIFNTYVKSYGNEWFGQPMFNAGMPYQFTVKFIGTHFQLSMNNVMMYSYPVMAPTDNMKAVDSDGLQTTNWIEMNCAEPPRTTPAPRPPHKGGYGGGKRPKGPLIIGAQKGGSDESD